MAAIPLLQADWCVPPQIHVETQPPMGWYLQMEPLRIAEIMSPHELDQCLYERDPAELSPPTTL